MERGINNYSLGKKRTFVFEEEHFIVEGTFKNFKKGKRGNMKKQISIEEAIGKIEDGMSVMIGGFLATGTPMGLVDALVAKGTKNLTLINNDSGFPDRGVGKLVVNNQFKKVIASHIGTNPETGKKMHSGEIEVELVPQGTLAERIRAGGAGLGAILTPTGVGTVVEEGKQKITLQGKDYLLEEALRADVALIQAEIADEKGNLIFDKAARNFNPLMAMAADIVIVEAKKIVPVGDIDPNFVMIPGEVVDFIVKGE